MPADKDLNKAFDALTAALDGSVDRLTDLERGDAHEAAATGERLRRTTVTVILLTLLLGLA